MNESPSPTGSNGRSDGGRFAVGNRFARGNPLAKRVQKLRVELVKAVGKGDLAEIIRKMIDLAKAGDTTAAKLVFDRALGPAVELDLIGRIEALEAAVTSRKK